MPALSGWKICLFCWQFESLSLSLSLSLSIYIYIYIYILGGIVNSDEMMADLSEGFSLLTLANNLRDVSVLFYHFNNGGLMEF